MKETIRKKNIFIKNLKEQEDGITLLSLIIMIIILFILASIGIYSTKDTIQYTKYNKAKSEMQIMVTEVNSLYEQVKSGNNDISNYGSKIEDLNSKEKENCDTIFDNLEITNNQERNGYKYFSSKYITDTLKIDGIDHSFLINVNNRKIILADEVEYHGKLYCLPEDFGMINIETNPLKEIHFKISQSDVQGGKNIYIYDINFLDETGEKANVSKFMLQYKKIGEAYWKNVNISKTNYTEDGTDYDAYMITLDSNGEYEFKISSTDGNLECTKSIEVNI